MYFWVALPTLRNHGYETGLAHCGLVMSYGVILVTIGSIISLLPDGGKPFTEPILIYQQLHRSWCLGKAIKLNHSLTYLSSVGPLGTNLIKIWIKMLTFFFTNLRTTKLAKRCQFSSDPIVLKYTLRLRDHPGNWFIITGSFKSLPFLQWQSSLSHVTFPCQW